MIFIESVWSETVKESGKPRPELRGEEKTDVLIIGGGMAGILTAYRLKKAGISCVVLEAKTIGNGVTKNTTAKITAQHGLIYDALIRRFGIEAARLYYDANMLAVKSFKTLSEKYPCDFEEKTAYVYSINDRGKIEREAEAYSGIGLNAEIKTDLPLPMRVAGAIAMENQAQFNPLKLLYALSEQIDLYENSFVHKVGGSTAYTEKGKIKAKNIVFATHFPLVNIPGLYFIKLYQHRSYVLALERAKQIDGMFIDEREDGHSFRNYGDLLLIGGGDHKTGKQGGGYTELRNLVKNAYPDAVEKYYWATQDCMTLDGIPYIGRHRAGTKNLFVATGFNKWGMTSSMAASKILTDMIVKGKSEFDRLYSPQRSMLSKQLFVNLGSAATGLVSIGGPRCSHMGCKLHWNKAEKTWDCHCHGSRFNQNGHLIDNPAKHGIRR